MVTLTLDPTCRLFVMRSEAPRLDLKNDMNKWRRSFSNDTRKELNEFRGEIAQKHPYQNQRDWGKTKKKNITEWNNVDKEAWNNVCNLCIYRTLEQHQGSNLSDFETKLRKCNSQKCTLLPLPSAHKVHLQHPWWFASTTSENDGARYYTQEGKRAKRKTSYFCIFNFLPKTSSQTGQQG